MNPSQAYFLAAATPHTPLIFLVSPLRRGRSYQVLSVQVLQLGKAVFSLSCSFQLPEPRQPTFQLECPGGIPEPEKCELREVRWESALEKEGGKWKERARKHLENMVAVSVRGEGEARRRLHGLS